MADVKELPDVQGKNREIGYKKPPAETRFKPGQSGNPAGRPKSAILSDAYRRKLNEVVPNDPEKRTYAEIIAAKVVLSAATGDMRAARELGDRVEGKARQTISLTLEQREKYEVAVSGMVAETGCSRAEAIATLSIFKPEVSELLN